MKDYRIEIGFAYSDATSKWFNEHDRKLIRDKVADEVYEALKKMKAFSDVDNIDKSLIKGDMTIYIG
jgi:hypothetical protein